MDEREFKDRIEKAIANADNLTVKEIRWATDFAKAARDALLMADATGNKDTRRRGEALAEKALSIVEEKRNESSQPAREPRGQPPISRSSPNRNGTLSVVEAVEMFRSLGEKGLPVRKEHWKAAGFVRDP